MSLYSKIQVAIAEVAASNEKELKHQLQKTGKTGGNSKEGDDEEKQTRAIVPNQNAPQKCYEIGQES